MAELEKLTSTVSGSTPEVLDQLGSEVAAAVASDDKLTSDEIQGALQALIESLESSGTISPGSILGQLQSASPEIASFITGIQESISTAKEATPQGLLLAQQLQNGDITQEQFDSQLQAIPLAPSQLQAAIAVSLPQQTQSLLLGLTNSPSLSQLVKLASSAPSAPDTAVPKLDGPEAGETATSTPEPAPGPPTLGEGSASNPVAPKALGKLTSQAIPVVPESYQLSTDKTDEKLGNGLKFLEKMIKVAAEIAAQNAKASAAALISLNPQPRIMTGARAVIKINGKVAALCTNVQYEINTDWAEIRGIDEILPNDLAPMSYSVKGSMSIYRVPNKSPVSEFLHQDMFRGIIWPYTTIELRDKRTDELIMLVKRCAITSRAEAFSKGTLTSTNLTFVGIGFRDEEMPELLPDELSGEKESNGGIMGAFKTISNLLS